MNKNLHWLLSMLWLASGLILMPIAQASLAISPPQLIANERGLVVTSVRSTEDSGTYWQVRVVRWSQQDGKDVLEPVPNAEITPRFFRLAAGKSQTLRALLPQDGAYYRLLIEQIAESGLQNTGLRFAFTFSLPVYRQKSEPAARTESWHNDAACADFSNDTDAAQVIDVGIPLSGARVVLPRSRLTLCRRNAPGS